MFSSTLPNPFIAREGEAPAEPLRHKLGRSLALPVANPFIALSVEKFLHASSSL